MLGVVPPHRERQEPQTQKTYTFYTLQRAVPSNRASWLNLIGEIQDKGSLQTLVGLLKWVFLAKLANFPHPALHLAWRSP